MNTFTTGKLDVKYVKDFWEKNPNIPRDSFLSKIIYGNEELHENFQKIFDPKQLIEPHDYNCEKNLNL